jgi:hypothetical protein
VIRQAISCDVCGAEKRQTNNWFMACNHGGELRISGWNARSRQRPGTKHLCGQTCLHKLVDEFMARTLAARVPSAQDEAEPEDASPSARMEKIEMKAAPSHAATARSGNERATDTSLTSNAAYDEEFESSARLIPTPMPPLPVRPPVELAAAATATRGKEVALLQAEPQRFASRNWRAEAWERERRREDGAAGHRREIGLRRFSSSK